ncbi:hypothetical protein TWF191_002924 [Orbilia oligospora]|uniref:Carboxymuconolactone decarboxylase-like domain-containing protein n=1 Tax=Orbilia oligospora TaxID=2813651 RepID=A0A7C8QAX2_ORBOL|nr:hypothetical protein TWF191_002924 [Orbilia oligospora]
MSAVARSILRRRELQRGIGRLCILKSVAALVPHGSLGSPEAPCSRYGSTLASAESNEIQSLLHSNDVMRRSIHRIALLKRWWYSSVKLKPLSQKASERIDGILFLIDDVEKEEDRDYTFSRDGWQADEKNLERGKGFLGKIYRHNMPRNDEKFIAHKDFAWITYNITYGLYLSDHTILDPFDTEVVALCGILIQNLESVTAFHLRGARRLGMTPEDVEGLHACCEKIAGFCRVRVDKVPRVADIEHEVAWE